MRIAVSADNKNGLDSVVSPHFGRCPYFILVDVAGQEIERVSAINNPYYNQHEPGQVPAFINSYDVNVMLTGGMGGRAVAFFRQFGIEPVTGAAGTVRQSLERYLGGTLQGAEACRESHDHAQRPVDGHGDASAEQPYEKDELGRLQEEADMLRQQLDQATERLARLE
ncbi:MAG: NifB/NifX family molybdenum-iron cluster-binding protein [Chloroflexi bacterium]|nr:NifB/NifX family molybdenum-iron cluster-binding protein [Chloroflexota bacterium]MBU1752091.1 NifB/NifX family molybdenum-iron cluster-binding protein [Chloroflexota bacterium]